MSTDTFQVPITGAVAFRPQLRVHYIERNGCPLDRRHWVLWRELCERFEIASDELWLGYQWLADRSVLALLGRSLGLRSEAVFQHYGQGEFYGACPVTELFERIAVARGLSRDHSGIRTLRALIGEKELDQAERVGHYPNHPKMIVVDGKMKRTYPARVDVALDHAGTVLLVKNVEVNGDFESAKDLDGNPVEFDFMPYLESGEFYVPYPFADQVRAHLE